ncbi:MAG TPA: PQQ-dependent sugar dehydrogenase, partial [Pseudonocardiaceae bacterium]|nr:PQQ-dependent sugar dehydrogenase [Pseudonocardiaceae bacterium]
MRLRRLVAAVTVAIAASAGLLVSSSPPALAVPTLPAGFVLTESATGLAATDAITDFAYLPDGSVLSIGKFGKVAWAAADGSARRTIATLPVYGPQDLGLIGLALAHDYAVSRRIYLAATYPVADSYVLRLAEWTVGGSPDPVRLGSPRTIIELPGRHWLHGMTSVVASSDGTLWVTLGDLLDPFVFPDNTRPFDLNLPEGKLLRITPDGRGVPGNPFYDAANPASWRSRVYAFGFRSPFRLSLDPRNGAPILGDVGQNTYEEVDYIRPGASYGWPCWEGNTPTPGYRDLPFCAGPAPNTAPVWVYDRAHGSSVIGGTFYTGDRYPAAYRGAYFFGDYTSQRIWSMQIDTQGRLTRAPEPGGFGTSIGRPVKFDRGPNGDIVFADIGTGRLNRLSYVPGNRPPRAVATTDTDPATRTVSFDGGRSYDPDGDALTYSWNFGDGTTGSGVSVSHTYAPGVVTATARLTVRDPAGATATTDIAVAPSNNPPRLELTAPGPGQRFAVGDTVQASATATDVEDGPLTVSWATMLVHCNGSACHDHPGRVSQGPAYAEPFSNHDDDTRMVVTATAADSRGVVTAETFEAVPRLRTLTLTSNVPATMVIGGQQRSSASVVVNAAVSFGASTTAADGVATFERWSDGGPQLRAGFTMPDAEVALTASFLTPIDRRFAADPALRNVIGPAIGGEQGTSTLRWRDHAYAGARLYWTPAAAVHEVHGAIHLNFRANGGHAVL